MSGFDGFTGGEIRLIKILVNKQLGCGYEESAGSFDHGDEAFERLYGEEFAKSLKAKYIAWLNDQEATDGTDSLVKRVAKRMIDKC